MQVSGKDDWRALLARARGGDVEAQCDAGLTYREGFTASDGEVVVKRSPKLALQWLEKAAHLGSAVAQDQLGVMLSEGEGGTRDLKRALHWARRAAAQRSGTSAHNLAAIYRDMGRHRSAFHWFREAAALGNRSSSVEVGIALFFGIGVKPNPGEACKYFRRVVRAEAPSEVTHQAKEDARLLLGVAFLRGEGVPRSLTKARAMLKQADADFENAAAQALLRVLGRRGR